MYFDTCGGTIHVESTRGKHIGVSRRTLALAPYHPLLLSRFLCVFIEEAGYPEASLTVSLN
jgi:hypothetical protein